MYMEGRILDFLDRLASSSPEPGGGAASALAAAVGAALVSMVGNLTIGKEKYADVQDRIRDMTRLAEEVRQALQELVQRDTEVYAVLSVAFKMPGDTDVQKKERAGKVQAALKEATMVPYEIADRCLDVAELSALAADIGNVNAVSDAGVAVLLAHAAAQCAALNVKINLTSITDGDFVGEKWSGIQDILSRAKKYKDEVVKVTYDKLG